ncbi:MAG: M20/M25/M40 family metallo-hydrolase [Salana multivorans]|nr:M20/M25/M40 family metallo-hydrolase [Salana multivorans]
MEVVVDVLELTRALVEIDSQNPGALEPEIARFVHDWATRRGYATTVLEPVAGRPNVLVTLDLGGERHLGLSGHLDTKPIGDALAQWRTPPLELTVDGDDAYGLGVTDMKGGVAAMMVALDRLATGPATATGRVTLLLSADEEQGSDAGAKALVEAGLLPPLDAVVIGEPSGITRAWEGIHLVSRGLCCFDVEITTTQGHSGLSPILGRNATLVAADLLHAFEEFRPTVTTPGEVACAPTVNPGIFARSGVSWGVWPGWCSIGIEIRLVPGMDQRVLHAEVAALVEEVVGDRAHADIRYKDSAQGWIDAVELSPGAAVARAARVATAEVHGAPAPFTAFPGATDATSFLGTGGIPTIASLGPGWISSAHGANERVGVGQLDEAVAIYDALARHYLAGAEA